MRRPLVLVGLPGSGKSTVGALVAEALGVPFVDLDRVIEREAGKSVERLFAEDGEPAFRALEARLGAKVLEGDPCVVSPGGGFPMDPGTRRLLASRTLSVYLVTSPAEAARRLARHSDRPLLEVSDRESRLRQLLGQRQDVYHQSLHQVTTDGQTPEAVAARVVELAREDEAL